MFTTFKNPNKGPQKVGAEKKSEECFSLLQEAIHGVLSENTDRIYIHEISHLVEFKGGDNFDLQSLKTALNNKRLKFLENKIVGGEILVHVFQILPTLQNVEVWYRPQSRPRI